MKLFTYNTLQRVKQGNISLVDNLVLVSSCGFVTIGKNIIQHEENLLSKI